ncbi:hypothetical protein F383_22734 [Gossypium arboreum]|uniref:Uncharacterized protein n=1 Tax=Gossypium arboreum TaxID=29729 RepID=A0A0B0NWZ6_GOSAR|nr:hypothetical protein F383_22734 [Gossypium arboreum]
MRPRLIIPP